MFLDAAWQVCSTDERIAGQFQVALEPTELR
jgi:hypothetical protein